MESWTQWLRPEHVRIGRLVLAVHQHAAEDVHEGCRWVASRPLHGGGKVALTVVAPDVEVQAVRGYPRASLGLLFGPRRMEEPGAGVWHAAGVEQDDQGVAPPGVVGGPLFATAVVEVLMGALVEALPSAAGDGSSLSGKGWCGP